MRTVSGVTTPEHDYSSFGRTPERWTVIVVEDRRFSKTYWVGSRLCYQRVPDRWHDQTLVPAHAEYIPGMFIAPSEHNSLRAARQRAADLVCVLGEDWRGWRTQCRNVKIPVSAARLQSFGFQ